MGYKMKVKKNPSKYKYWVFRTGVFPGNRNGHKNEFAFVFQEAQKTKLSHPKF